MIGTLRVTEIFLSLQGETSSMGFPTIFVRLTGCPLRCHYCDTAYAFSGGDSLPVSEILERVKGFGVRHVTVTGGEPLAQPDVHRLLSALCDEGLRTLLETSGALDVSTVDARVIKILDLKTPGSGEAHRNQWSNLAHCGQHDEVKFVICSREDYEWARMKVDEHALDERFANVLFSPSSAELEARELAEWIVADALEVRMQVQLHKLLWGEEPGR
ncbi:MAG: 7-carboxy-7-deazaguanine synthase QueE [Pseudomonadales bacterium]|jgi:7-carboxy-7-deazaguanine synthase|nr:7-carboxy-7-deazaguanine synthase QueE [Pseudomonadales bacterium]MDP6470996.1 7-carboxy-7-deazaguanine synthase QueE [Pseudomonadales bacterium]MDP6825819.1 7-carboxy-7-deazaguanine synthase QueE [Pseudomonadales bacterium]MDP6970188.1 7-carboxy-7-deazaguanine synthase QueE [Pseudomonadales bacterium]|tara:strand:+ start:661 stop:1308 length:648 start_codon:yes stop_codon:yes gene_type:complete